MAKKNVSVFFISITPVIYSLLLYASWCTAVKGVCKLESETLKRVWRLQSETLNLNDQNILYNAAEDDITIGVTYNGRCHSFFVKFVRLDENGTIIPEQPSNFTAKGLAISFPVAKLGLDEVDPPYFFNIVAVDDNGATCSDDMSLMTFYQLERRGIPSWGYQSTIELPIPKASQCHTNTSIVFVWPKRVGIKGQHCFCEIHGFSRTFQMCAKMCGTNYDIKLIGESILFRNISLNETEGGFLVHFICDETSVDNSYLVSIVTSYKIKTSASESEAADDNSFGTPFIAVLTVTGSIIAIQLIINVFMCVRARPQSYKSYKPPLSNLRK